MNFLGKEYPKLQVLLWLMIIISILGDWYWSPVMNNFQSSFSFLKSSHSLCLGVAGAGVTWCQEENVDHVLSLEWSDADVMA